MLAANGEDVRLACAPQALSADTRHTACARSSTTALQPKPTSTTPSPPLQIVSVDARGAGIKRIRPKSLYDMLKVGASLAGWVVQWWADCGTLPPALAGPVCHSSNGAALAGCPGCRCGLNPPCPASLPAAPCRLPATTFRRTPERRMSSPWHPWPLLSPPAAPPRAGCERPAAQHSAA